MPALEAVAGFSCYNSSGVMMSLRSQTELRVTSKSGFTLVELLVVIGIIALLIGILLPSLTRAREASRRIECAAKLRQIMLAAQIHALEHKGYYPLAGLVYGDGGLLSPPAVIRDPNAIRYDYLLWPNGTSDSRTLGPITFALGTSMGFKTNEYINTADWNAEINADSDRMKLIRHFLCPSQATAVTDIEATPNTWPYLVWGTAGYYTYWYNETQSYVFNEALLGYNDSYYRLCGREASVRKNATRTMFAADGLSVVGPTRLVKLSTIFNNSAYPAPVQPITLADALDGRMIGGSLAAGSAASFDRHRHAGKINIVFCDGHAETRAIPVLANDPTAKALADVYLLPPS